MMSSKPARFTRLGALTLNLLAAATACVTQAANIYWTGPAASYTNAIHWDGGVVPGTADNAINTNGLGNVVQINSGNPDWTVIDVSAGGVTNGAGAFEQNGGILNVNGWMLIGSGTDATGAFTLNGGALNIVGGRLFLGDHPGSTSTFTMNGGVLTKSGDFVVIGDGGWNGSGARTAVFNQNGGIINSTSEFQIGNIPLADGTYNLTAGTNNTGNWFSVGRFGGAGKFNMSGGEINKTGGGNFYVGEGVGTGEFNFTGGTININSEYWLGNGGTCIATQNMSGTASMTVGNWIAIGRNGGAGTLNLTNGTITKIGGGNLAIGAGGGAGAGLVNQYGGLINNTANPNSLTYLAENGGNGTWNMFGGTATLGVLQFCQGGNGAGTLSLHGGLLNVREVNCGVSGANGMFFFNGGTLQANADNANFFSGLGGAYVDAGGVVIDSQGFNITMAQTLTDLGGGGLTKLGTGTLVLGGFNTYSGATTVSAGKLITTANSTAAGSYTVANNAGFGVGVVYDEAQVIASSLTLSGPTAASLDFSLGNFGNPTLAPLSVTGTFDVNGTVTVNIASDLPQIGQFPLVAYGARTGSGNFVIGSLPVGVLATIVTNGNAIELNITSVNLPRWAGQDGGNWDIGLTTNWVNIGNSLPTTYGQGNFVLFDDNAQGTTTVNLTTTVNPGSVTVNNSTLAYSMVGSGKISGSIGLVKQGTGTLNLLNTGGNNYAGPTVISNGVLSVTNLANGGVASPIGASSASPTNLVLVNGALSYAGAPVSVNRGFTLMGTNSTIDAQTDFGFSGAVVSSGNRFVKTGPARFTYSNTGSNLLSANLTPGLHVIQGTMAFEGSATQTNRVQNDAWIGGTQTSGAALLLTNTTLIVDAWIGLGRGNGTVGNVSTMTLYNSLLRSGNFSAGFDNGIAGNSATQAVTLNGTSMVYNNGPFHLAESAGSFATLTLNDSSVWTNRGDANLTGSGANRGAIININNNAIFGSNNRIEVGRVGATGIVTVANSGKLLGNAWFSVGNGTNGNGTLIVKDSGSVYCGDLNITDTGASIGSMTVQDNATVNGGAVFIGKASGTVANATVSGGLLNSRGGFTMGNSAGSLGTLNISGGAVNAQGNFVLGNASTSQATVTLANANVTIGGELWLGQASATGTWSQVSGSVISTNWVAIGRQNGSKGTYTISGGSLAELDTADRFLVGSGGAGTLNISGSGHVWARGDLQLAENASGSGVLNLDGGTLSVRRVYRGAGPGTFNFNGGTLVASNVVNVDFFNGLTAAFVKSGGANINSGTNTININQALLDGTGGGGLTKTGPGTLRLNGANTYTGNTTVNAGTLGGTGTILGPVSVASGATLAPGASIGTLTISNTLTLAAGSTTFAEITLDGGATNDVVRGLSSVSYNGSLVVTNVGTNVLVAGSTFKLFDAAAPGSGNFASVTIVPLGYGTFNPSTGVLTITSSGVLAFNPTTASGGNLVLSGTGGQPGGSYSWLTSTNVAAPVATWTTNLSGVFSASGGFTNAIPINTSETARFFRLKTP